MTEKTGLKHHISKFICCYADDDEYEPYVFIPQSHLHTYSQVKKMTKNFSKVHGKGSFGIVYRGVFNKQQVAVKMINRASIYDIKEFTTEVNSFAKVRHPNLVSLIGYCDDSEHLGLIYEFVANGNLKDHLAGKFGNVLSWESRLKIMIGVAQGLEHLHNDLRILHRYIKPQNILLDENFEAKLADFGLSRSSPTNHDTQASNKIYVNPGRNPYLHDEYFSSNHLTEVSDIHSFSIVLLEVITNQPVVDINRESPHISNWVNLKDMRGEALEIVDPRLNSDFEPNSVRKAIDSRKFARMSQTVINLKECLALEMARIHGTTGETTQETQ